MTDTSKFINTYIDTAIAALHEYVGSSLQLKTQLKLANDLVQEKDSIIASLSNELQNRQNIEATQQASLQEVQQTTQTEINNLRAELFSCQDKLRIAEDSHNALKTKAGHMDTLTKQIGDMKNEIKIRDDKIFTVTNDLTAKDAQISSLNQTITELNANIVVKDKQVSELKSKLDKLNEKKAETSNSAPIVEKLSKESSTVKVQLNTKSKPKELPIDDDF